jgi:hypothetical protein
MPPDILLRRQVQEFGHNNHQLSQPTICVATVDERLGM